MRSLLLVSLACWLAPSVAAADLPDIQKAGTIRVIVWTDNLPELFSAKPGPEPGLEYEILEGFTRLRRLKIAIVTVPSLDARIPALLRGEGDMVAGGLVNTESRRRLVDFTAELFPIRHVAVTRKPHPPITTLEQLHAVKVGTVKGSSWADQIQQAGVPASQVNDSYASPDALMAGLRAGEVSAVVLSVVWAAAEVRRDPQLELGVLMGESTSVGYAVPREAPLLRAALDEFISNLRRTPTWSRLVVKYFGEKGLEILRKSR
jgi:ABC-type amino acid transport substrate-binding protein